MFPFGHIEPRKNSDLVKYDFVDTYFKVERYILGNVLKLYGYKINKHIYNRKGYIAVGIPKNKDDDLVSDGFNIYVRAQQIYHGARNHHGIYQLISKIISK
jgi:hypothetical protein